MQERAHPICPKQDAALPRPLPGFLPATLRQTSAAGRPSSHDRTARQGSGFGEGGGGKPPPPAPAGLPGTQERQKEQAAAQAERSDGNGAARAAGCNAAPDKSRPAAEKGEAEAKAVRATTFGRAEGNRSAARGPFFDRGAGRGSLGEPSASPRPAAQSEEPPRWGGRGVRSPPGSERHGWKRAPRHAGLPRVRLGSRCKRERAARPQHRPDGPVWDAGLIKEGGKLSPEAVFILQPSTRGHQWDPLSRRGIGKKKAFVMAGNAPPAKQSQLVTDPRHPIPPRHEAAAADGMQDNVPLLQLVPPPA